LIEDKDIKKVLTTVHTPDPYDHILDDLELLIKTVSTPEGYQKGLELIGAKGSDQKSIMTAIENSKMTKLQKSNAKKALLAVTLQNLSTNQVYGTHKVDWSVDSSGSQSSSSSTNKDVSSTTTRTVTTTKRPGLFDRFFGGRKEQPVQQEPVYQQPLYETPVYQQPVAEPTFAPRTISYYEKPTTFQSEQVYTVVQPQFLI